MTSYSSFCREIRSPDTHRCQILSHSDQISPSGGIIWYFRNWLVCASDDLNYFTCLYLLWPSGQDLCQSDTPDLGLAQPAVVVEFIISRFAKQQLGIQLLYFHTSLCNQLSNFTFLILKYGNKRMMKIFFHLKRPCVFCKFYQPVLN